MAAVLARYQKLISAGEAAPVPPPASTARTVRPADTTVTTARAARLPMPETSPASAPTDDTLDAIRTDLKAIVGRLDGLARKGGQ